MVPTSAGLPLAARLVKSLQSVALDAPMRGARIVSPSVMARSAAPTNAVENVGIALEVGATG